MTYISGKKKKICGLTLDGTRGFLGDAACSPPPQVFREYRNNALTDLAKIWCSFLSILFTPILESSASGLVDFCDLSHSSEFSCSLTYVPSLYAGYLVFGHLEAICSRPRVKVTHARGRFCCLFSVIPIRTF